MDVSAPAPSGTPPTPPGGSSAAPSTGVESAASAPSSPEVTTAPPAPESAAVADASPATDAVAVTSEESPFDWSAWSGDDEIVPETYRDAVKAVRSHANKRYDADIAAAKERYDALTAERTAAEEAWTTKFQGVSDESYRYKAALDKITEAAEARAAEESKAWSAGLAQKFPDVFGEKARPEASEMFGKFLDAGLTPDGVESVLDLISKDAKSAGVALERMAKGYPIEAALEVAQLAAASAPKLPGASPAGRAVEFGGPAAKGTPPKPAPKARGGDDQPKSPWAKAAREAAFGGREQ